jgi:Ca2+-binding EF-hand superfamily protein
MSEIDPNELIELKEIFDKLDSDKDGKLSVKELGYGMKMLGESVGTDEDMLKFLNEQSMALMDIDNNGTIEFDEFAKVMSLKEDSDGMISAAFRLCDRNNDGYITASEMKYFLASTGENVPDSDIDEMINEADLNKDGKLNYEGELILVIFHKSSCESLLIFSKKYSSF